MLEYVTLLGGNLQDAWRDQVLPLWATIHGSPFFWPGVVAAGLTMLVITKKVLK